jgi:quinol monooxygenase YgiN
MPVLVATISAKPDQIEAAVAALQDIVPAVHDEDGCELYALHRGPDRLVFIEKWRDQPALDGHRTAKNVQTLRQRLSDLGIGVGDVQVLEGIPLGDSDKGAL